mgnify:CR=1 FL=1|jgi:hypothetical protein
MEQLSVGGDGDGGAAADPGASNIDLAGVDASLFLGVDEDDLPDDDDDDDED